MENIDDQETTKSRIKEDRIPTRIEKLIRDTTRTRHIGTMSETIKDMTQESVSRVANAINKPLKSTRTKYHEH